MHAFAYMHVLYYCSGNLYILYNYTQLSAPVKGHPSITLSRVVTRTLGIYPNYVAQSGCLFAQQQDELYSRVLSKDKTHQK